MKKSNKMHANNLLSVIEELVDKAVEEKLENYIKFLMAQVINIDECNGRAQIKYLEIDGNSGQQNYNTLNVAVKTEEKIAVGDLVLVLYTKNFNSAFISGKISNSYYSRRGISE